MHSEQSDAVLARRGGWREAVLSWQVSVPSAKVVAVEEARGTATAQAKVTAEVSVACVCVCVPDAEGGGGGGGGGWRVTSLGSEMER